MLRLVPQPETFIRDDLLEGPTSLHFRTPCQWTAGTAHVEPHEIAVPLMAGHWVVGPPARVEDTLERMIEGLRRQLALIRRATR